MNPIAFSGSALGPVPIEFLRLGFGLLAKHFEDTEIPAVLPRWLPDDWKGCFVRGAPRGSAATPAAAASMPTH